MQNLKLIVNDINVWRIWNRNRCLELANGEFLLIESVGDTISEVNVKKDLLEMKEKSIHISYCGFDVDIRKINIFFAFPLSFCNDLNIFLSWLGAFIFNLDLIKDNNLYFDENLSFYADAKLEYDYLKILKYWKCSNQCLFKHNKNRKDRFVYNSTIQRVYDIKYLLDYESQKYNVDYNKNKLHFLLLSRLIVLYIKSQFTKSKLKISDIKTFVDKCVISNLLVVLSILFSPVMFFLLVSNIFWQSNGKSILHLPIFVVKNSFES
jgi:hypothetical protein